ncbi:MAG: TetR/AcrR family transcriptional regulator [Bacteroidota bacterium]|jgi:AcrR family transcriptional regulator
MVKEQEIKIKILLEAKMLFMRYGFKSITMDDISRELGVSKKTLYQHFEDKYDLVDRCVDHQIIDMNCNCDELMEHSEDPISAMLSISDFIGNAIRILNPSAMFDLKKYFKPAWDKLQANRKNHIYNLVIKNLENGRKKGLYRKEIDPEITCRIFVYLIGFITDPEHYDRQEMDFKTLHLEMTKYHLRAICTPKGIELLEEKLTHRK